MSKNVLITGAASGFGRALVTLFLEQGWTVYAGLRRVAERQSDFAAELHRFESRLHLVELDITRPEERHAVTQQLSAAGGLDALVNNAGFGLFGPFEVLSESDLRRQHEVNFFGTVLLTQSLLPLLRAARGRIVNIGSIAGRVGMPLSSAYGASKFALAGWSEGLRFELKPQGVDVVLIEPGAFRTGFTKHLVFRRPSGALHEVYGSVCERYARILQGQTHGVTDLKPVLQAVLRVAEQGARRSRIACGADARRLGWLRKLLPDSLYDALMSWNYRRKLGVGKFTFGGALGINCGRRGE